MLRCWPIGPRVGWRSGAGGPFMTLLMGCSDGRRSVQRKVDETLPGTRCAVRATPGSGAVQRKEGVLLVSTLLGNGSSPGADGGRRSEAIEHLRLLGSQPRSHPSDLSG